MRHGSKRVHALFALLSVALLWPLVSHGQPQIPLHAAPPADKELIAVLDLEAVGADKVQASGMSDRLREELLKTGKYILVNRDQMDVVLNEQAFQQSGCTTSECAVKVGQMLGVRKLVTGRVTKFDERHWQLSAIVIDVETAQTQRAESIQHEGDFFSLLSTGIGGLAVKLTGGQPGLQAKLQKANPVNPGFLGIRSADITPEIASTLAVKPREGVLVTGVGRDTPAAKSGIKLGDIIVTFRSQPVNSPKGMVDAVAEVTPGEIVPAEVLTNGIRRAVKIQIGERPADMYADTMETIEDFDQAIRLHSNYAFLYASRGAAYSDRKQYPRAIEDYDQAIRLDPTDANAYLQRGLAYNQLKQNQRAIEDLDQAIRLDPNNAYAYTTRGAAYLQLTQYQRAIEDLDQAIRLKPDFESPYYFRGSTHLKLGQRAEGYADYRKACALGLSATCDWLSKYPE